VGGFVSPVAAGLSSALRHRRLAGVLWLSLLASALLAWFPLRSATQILDSGPFRESLLRGWDSWGTISFLLVQRSEVRLVLAASLGSAAAFALLQIFLTGGMLRALIAGRTRHVFATVVAESASLFKANLWAAARFALSSVFWLGLLVAVPCAALSRVAKNAPPHGGAATLLFWWALVGGLFVLFNTGLRFDLARIALARDDARNARGAYRVAQQRLSGRRGSGIRIILFWIVAFVAVQALFTSLGLRLNPHTNGAVAGLFVFRQIGFFLLAMGRIGFFASLLAWEERRRPAHSVMGSATGGTTWNVSDSISVRAPASAFPATGSSVMTNGSALLSS
jgi:hypothetical protein